jgi:hypothetical protein
VLAELAEESPAALEALAQLVFLADGEVPSAFVVYGLGDALGLVDANDAHLRALTRSTFDVLRARYLVTSSGSGTVGVPRLAKTILVDLLHHRGAEICEHARAGILAVAKLTRADHQDLPLLEFARLHGMTLVHLRSTFVDPHKSAGLLSHVYVYAQALQAFLEAIGEDGWRLAILAVQGSETSFSLVLCPIPRSADHVENLRLVFGWENPEPMEVPLDIKGWRGRKRMQIAVVYQDGTVDDDLLFS